MSSDRFYTFNCNNYNTGVQHHFGPKFGVRGRAVPQGMPGAPAPEAAMAQAETPGLKSPDRVRKLFPETWIWADTVME